MKDFFINIGSILYNFEYSQKRHLQFRTAMILSAIFTMTLVYKVMMRVLAIILKFILLNNLVRNMSYARNMNQ